MIVRNIEITTSPVSSDRPCVRAEVVLENTLVPPEVFWFDVPQWQEAHLSGSGNPWLALLIPYAMNLGERLKITKPVDGDLYANVHELMRIWRCWYPHLHPVPIEAEIRPISPTLAPNATGAMFSGGVDAWFTLLSHSTDSARPDKFPPNDLLCVWGLDVPLDKPNEFRAMREVLVGATSSFGVKFVDIATNLRQTNWWQKANWGHMAHGCALASIALALEGRYARLLIPSTHRYDHCVPWGSHPVTDPLLSSSLTKIMHDGAAFSRVEKTAVLATSEDALNSLQVCWAMEGFANCGKCSKCYRTMTTLQLVGALGRCSRFGRSSIDTAHLARLLSLNESDRAFMREVRDLAVQKGQHHIAQAIQESFKYSRRIESSLRLRKWLGTNPFIKKLRDWQKEYFMPDFALKVERSM